MLQQKKLAGMSSDTLANILIITYQSNDRFQKQLDLIMQINALRGEEDQDQKTLILIGKEIDWLKKVKEPHSGPRSTFINQRIHYIRHIIMESLMPHLAAQALKFMKSLVRIQTKSYLYPGRVGYIAKSTLMSDEIFKNVWQDFFKIMESLSEPMPVSDVVSLIYEQSFHPELRFINHILPIAQSYLGNEGLNFLQQKFETTRIINGFETMHCCKAGMQAIADCKNDPYAYQKACRFFYSANLDDTLKIVERFLRHKLADQALIAMNTLHYEPKNDQKWDDYKIEIAKQLNQKLQP